jgi:hypothetical protein
MKADEVFALPFAFIEPYVLPMFCLCPPTYRKLSRATTPKTAIITPETRLIHCNHVGVKRRLNRLIALVSSSHQQHEPVNTPHTTSSGGRMLPLLLLDAPIPAKIATNERMVSGLVNVSSSVEIYAVTRLSALVASAALLAGFVSIVLIPR